MSALTASHERRPGAASIERSSNADIGLDDLRELMRSVSETTQRLQSTHVALQNQVARLQRELAEANAALRRSQALAALGEVAAGIAHEVRNPLGSIQLYAQMLAEDLSDRPAQAEICGKIDRAVVGLDAIVRDVLTFARNMSVSAEPTSTDILIERSLANCQALLKQVELQRPPCAPLRLHADAGLIVQALNNIIRNAVEAIVEANSPHRQLCITTSRRRVRCPNGRQENRIVIAVQDTGPGIPVEVLDRIFNPFFTTRRSGTGLGLAIVHRIVDAHGGHVNIENVSSTGTRVELCLPARPPQHSQDGPQHNIQPAALNESANFTEHGA